MYITTFVFLNLLINYIIKFVEDAYFFIANGAGISHYMLFVSGLPFCERR